ncbi:MAG: phosphoenolpyruvate-utilizing N-terminal domain-containing protein, partial [Dongiaceae bacterium]
MFDGLGVSQGVAIGAAHVVEAGYIDVPEYAVAEDAVAAEQQRFADAVAKSQRQLKKLREKSAALHGTAAE